MTPLCHERVILRCVQSKIRPELYTIAGPAWSGHFHRVMIFTTTSHQFIPAGKQDRVALDYGWADMNGKMDLERWEHVYLPSIFSTPLERGVCSCHSSISYIYLIKIKTLDIHRGSHHRDSSLCQYFFRHHMISQSNPFFRPTIIQYMKQSKASLDRISPKNLSSWSHLYS